MITDHEAWMTPMIRLRARYFVYLIALLVVAFSMDARAFATTDNGMSAWIDHYVRNGLRKTDAPGAVVAIVKDGRVVLLRGYGMADVRSGRRIDPSRTLFRIGSISKVMTAIVALQLRDEGKLNFEVDVNRYMPHGFHIPAYAGLPVTLNELLSHTAGFSADIENYVVSNEADTAMSPGLMQRLLPSRSRRPGEYVTYDNIGFGIVGLAEEDVTGSSYADLVARRVFKPLGMKDSYIGLPIDLWARASREHNVMPDGHARVIPYFLLRHFLKPAGDVSTTGADMARFMMALLNGGNLNDKRVLSPASFSELIDFKAHKMNPYAPAVGRAIIEDFPAGRHVWMHTGGTYGFGSGMLLFPKDKIGVFISINALQEDWAKKGDLFGVLRSLTTTFRKPNVTSYFGSLAYEFAKRFTKEPVPARPFHGPKADLSSLVGEYEDAAAHDNLTMKIASALATVSVREDKEGGLTIGGLSGYHEVAPLVFATNDGKHRVAFAKRAGNTLLYFNAEIAVKKQQWPTINLLAAVGLLLPPLTLLSGFLYLLIRRRDRASRVAVYAAVCGLLFLLSLFLELEYADTFLVGSHTILLHMWRLILVAAPALSLTFLAWGEICAIRGAVPLSIKVHFGVLSFAAAWLFVACLYWGMLTRF